MDAAPEIERIKPDIYAVNEDGDKGGKSEYCREHGIEYLVFQRLPAPGLARRSSTDLRGFYGELGERQMADTSDFLFLIPRAWVFAKIKI